VDRYAKGGGYAVIRPRRGPSDDEVRMLIKIQQEGEIAFQLHSLAQLQLVGGRLRLESRTYEA
jgi:hypothetical protein